MITLPATGCEEEMKRESTSCHCDLWIFPTKQPICPSRRKSTGRKFNASLLITLLILLLVSSVKSHLPSGHSVDQSGPSQSLSTGASSSNLANVFPDSSPLNSPASKLKKASQGNIYPFGNITPSPPASTDVDASGQKEQMSPSLISPDYFTITSNFGERTKFADQQRQFTPPSLPRPPRVRQFWQGKKKRSTPSCGTLKSLWRSGKLVTLDSIFASEPIYQDFHLPTNDIQTGFFGNFAPQEQEQISPSSFDEAFDENQIVNFQMDPRPIFHVQTGATTHSSQLGNGADSQSTFTSDEDAPPKSDDFSQAANFFDGVWYNEPVKF